MCIRDRYSGSAGWLYRAGVEWVLGIRPRGSRLVINPCIPAAWSGFSATVRHGTGRYEITVENPNGLCRGVVALELDGAPLTDRSGVPLTDDGKVHTVRVTMGAV